MKIASTVKIRQFHKSMKNLLFTGGSTLLLVYVVFQGFGYTPSFFTLNWNLPKHIITFR